MRSAPAVKQASSHAPQALAYAEALRRSAESAYDQRDLAGASILAERALAAYERAILLARSAKAEDAARHANSSWRQSEQELTRLQAQQQTVSAELERLEQMLKVIRDAQPLTPTDKADEPAREAARLKATQSILVDARLLCAATRLLALPVPDLDQAEAQVTALNEAVSRGARPAPIDEARRARTRCLSLLTSARRQAAAPAAAGTSDIVLSELSGNPLWSAQRDERGVVAVLDHDVLNEPARLQKAAEDLAGIAKRHPDSAVLIVAHTSTKPRPAEVERATKQAEQVANTLKAQGISAARIRVEQALGAQPHIWEPRPPPAQSRNHRLEVLFVTPAS